MQSPSTSRMGSPGRRSRSQPVPCRQCKRRYGQAWKRCRPYEKFDVKCEHQAASPSKQTYLKCDLPMQVKDDRSLICASPECQPSVPSIAPGLPTKLPLLPKDDAPFTKTSEQVKQSLSKTDCRNCQMAGVTCSGSVTGLRCDWCEVLNLNCDGKVRLKACVECMKMRRNTVWKSCVGVHNACDSCLEKGTECKEYVPGPDGDDSEDKRSNNAVADGTLDPIDGMKGTRAFTNCGRCLEEKMKCDEELPDCKSCEERGVVCRYRILATAFSYFSWGRKAREANPTTRSSELNDRDQGPQPALPQATHLKGEEDSPDEIPLRRPRFPLPCTGCRKSMVRCSGTLPTCDRCEKLGLDCCPNPRVTRGASGLAAKAQESVVEAQVEILENMMSDLEIGGWHFVSREEVEEAVKVESGRT